MGRDQQDRATEATMNTVGTGEPDILEDEQVDFGVEIMMAEVGRVTLLETTRDSERRACSG